jgi:hypothetical protein
MKKPEKQTPLCPLIQSECVEEGCKFFLEMERRNIATGSAEKYRECAFIVQIGVLSENSMAINRMVESMGSFRDHTVDAIRNHSLAMAIHLDKGFGNVKAIEEKKE